MEGTWGSGHGVGLIFNHNVDHQTKAATDNSDITYCVGLWLVPGNKKRSREHYLAHLPKTLELLKNKKVIFLYDDDSILEFVRAKIETKYFFAKKVLVNEMRAHHHIDQLIASAKKFKIVKFARLKAEKGLIHYNRDLIGSGEDAYKTILAVWLSKVFVVHDIAIKKNPFNTNAFAWVDASLSRVAINRNSANFVDVSATDKVLMRGSGMRYKGKQINFSAGFILATIENWRMLNKHYSEEFSKAIYEPYPNDDETLLHKISMKHSHLFRKIEPTNKSYKNPIKLIHRKILDSYYSTIYFLIIYISNMKN